MFTLGDREVWIDGVSQIKEVFFSFSVKADNVHYIHLRPQDTELTQIGSKRYPNGLHRFVYPIPEPEEVKPRIKNVGLTKVETLFGEMEVSASTLASNATGAPRKKVKIVRKKG